MSQPPLPDVQNERPRLPLPLASVGVRGLAAPVTVPGMAQPALATVDLGVSLGADKRGIHMSRLARALQTWDGALGTRSVGELLATIRTEAGARRAWAAFSFSLLVEKAAPASGQKGRLACPCRLEACLAEAAPLFLASLEAPVMTVCPCSLAICAHAAHSQRALARLRVIAPAIPAYGRLLALAESSGSFPVYALLKREDEKLATESAFANPAFVEDVARSAASQLAAQADFLSWQAEAESLESIHSHNAFAICQAPDWPSHARAFGF